MEANGQHGRLIATRRLEYRIPASPIRSSNASINDLDVLLPRLEQCQAERGRLPNLVVVDFGDEGDALDAVDQLNRVAASQ